MSLSQESLRPVDSAIVDYCCAFFGRTITLCWQDLPVQERGSREVLLNLKDYFLAALTNDFLGGVSAVEEVCATAHWSDSQRMCEFLDTLEARLVKQCTEDSAKSLFNIQQRLNETYSYNELAFDPRTLMAYILVAVLKSDMNRLLGTALCYKFIQRLGIRIPLFYSTLEDVLQGWESSQPSDNRDLSNTSQKDTQTGNQSINQLVNSFHQIDMLTGYIQRFYTSNLQAQLNHPVLSSLFQNIYATLLCYVRDSADDIGKKSEILRQVLQELYDIANYDDVAFDKPSKNVELILQRLQEPEPYLWRTLKFVCEELNEFKRAIDVAATPKPSNESNTSCEIEVISEDTRLQILRSNVFHFAEHLINEALTVNGVGEVSAFIDRYWRHALLITGLKEGIESNVWQEATRALEELTRLHVMAAVSSGAQTIVLDRMRAIGKHYLSYNDFLEREEYLQNVSVVPLEQWRSPITKR